MTTSKTRLIFDHVPKTAGQSITAALGRAFGESGALPRISNRHWHAVTSAGLRRLLCGHLWFAPGESLAEGWYYCTLLRDPVDRFLSQYAFNRSIALQLSEEYPGDERLSDPQVVEAARCSLEEYLAIDAPDIKSSYTNVQAVHFAQRMCSHPGDLSDAALLDAAAAALDGYDLVGTFEDLQGFVDAVCWDFGFETKQLPMLNENSTRKRPENGFPPHLIGHLLAANRVDLQLVDLARQHFAARSRSRARGPAASSPPAAIGIGTREIEILSARCAGDSSGTSSILSGETVRLDLECIARTVEDDLTIGIAVRDRSGQLIYGTNSRILGQRISIANRGPFKACLALRPHAGIGEYLVTVALHKGTAHFEGCYHWMDWVARFEVVGLGKGAFEGQVDLGLELHIETPEKGSPG